MSLTVRLLESDSDSTELYESLKTASLFPRQHGQIDCFGKGFWILYVKRTVISIDNTAETLNIGMLAALAIPAGAHWN
jgi:hypothetical protein